MTAGAITAPRPAPWPWFDWSAIKKWLKWLLMFSFMVQGIQVITDTPGNTYYVDDISTDCTPATTGSGTLSDPWTNPYYAVTQGGLQPGDTLMLRGGYYYVDAPKNVDNTNDTTRLDSCAAHLDVGGGTSNDTAVISLGRLYIEGTAGNPITITNYPGEDVIISATSAEVIDVGWTQCNSPNTDVWYIAHDTGTSDEVVPWHSIDAVNRVPATWSQYIDGVSWAGGGTCPASSAIDPLNIGGWSEDATANEIVIHMPNGTDPNLKDGWCITDASGENEIGLHVSTSYINIVGGNGGGEFVIQCAGNNSLLTDGDAHGTILSTAGTEATFITVDNVVIWQNGERGYGLGMGWREGNDNTFKNSELGYSSGEGGGPYCGDTNQNGAINCFRIVWENNNIHHSGQAYLPPFGSSTAGTNLGHGIISRNCTDCIFRGNTIDFSFRNGISISIGDEGSGPTANDCTQQGDPCRHDNVIIEGNIIRGWGHFVQGIPPWVDADLVCAADTAGIYVTTNSNAPVNDPTLSGVNGTIIRNNQFEQPCTDSRLAAASKQSPSIKIASGNILTPVDDWIVAHNSFADDTLGANFDSDENAWQDTGLLIGNSFRYDGSSTACNGNACAVFLRSEVADPTTKYNNYWSPNTTDVVVKNGASYTRANVTNFEATATTVDPDYVDGTSLPADLHINNTSGLQDNVDCAEAGVPADDFDGDARPSSGTVCDAGMHQFD